MRRLPAIMRDLSRAAAREMAIRSPENLVQALEQVAGVHQISEGHAVVPAIRPTGQINKSTNQQILMA